MLEEGEVWIHSAILGELAAGTLKNRIRILSDLKLLPRIPEVPQEETLGFIEARKLHGKGLGWIDIQLLACSLAAGCELFTEDRRLQRTFRELR